MGSPVKVKGVDVFHPTPRSPSDGAAVSPAGSSTPMTTASFFVRPAYFLGGNDPTSRSRQFEVRDYEELGLRFKRPSRRFDKPEGSRPNRGERLNHLGDEVMKVFRGNCEFRIADTFT